MLLTVDGEPNVVDVHGAAGRGPPEGELLALRRDVVLAHAAPVPPHPELEGDRVEGGRQLEVLPRQHVVHVPDGGAGLVKEPWMYGAPRYLSHGSKVLCT